MTPQDWESPGVPAVQPGQPAMLRGLPPQPGRETAAAYTLRPLTTGEVLDTTFSIYRSRFWLFAGLASLSGAFSMVLNLLQLVVHHILLLHYGLRAATIEAQISSMLVGLLSLPVVAVVYAASVFALCELYLGREVTAGIALRATIDRWLRYVAIALWQGWSAVWVFVVVGLPSFLLLGYATASAKTPLVALGGFLTATSVLGGGVYGVIAYIRNSLAIPAALMEQSGVRASMRRSKTLAAGTKGRIFVVLLVATALYLVAGAVQAPMLFVIARAPREEHVLAQAAILLIGFIGHTLVSPVALIGLTLVYFDQRVRLEAFDLMMMLGPQTPAMAEAPGMAAAGVSREIPAVSAAAEPWEQPAPPIEDDAPR